MEKFVRVSKLEISEFGSLDEIDPILFDQPYYLEPDKCGRKAYALLRQALRVSGRAGISRVVIQTLEYLSVMFVRGEVLMLMLLRFPQEIRAVSKLDLPLSTEKEWQSLKKEMDLALRLTDEMTGKWRPEEFHDDYWEVLMALHVGEEPNWLLRKLGEDVPAAAVQHEAARFISPQLAPVVPSVPTGRPWLHEIKFDGYRLMAVKKDGEVRIFMRNQLDWTDRFQALADSLRGLGEHDCVLDGEAVVLDEKGRSRFGMLQAALQSGEGGKISYMVFDLLHYKGRNLRDNRLLDRIEELKEFLGDETGPIVRSKVWPSEMGSALFRQACEIGL